MHFFGFIGLAATGAGILTGFLLLFQKVAARAVFASNATLTFATIALLLAWSSNHVHGIRIGNIVTHILRIPEETSLRHEANGNARDGPRV